MIRITHYFALAMTLLSIAAAGCTSPAPLDASSLRPPEVGPPTIEVVVLAGDDLSVLDADIAVEGASMFETDEGVPAFVWSQDSTTIEVSAPGFEPQSEIVDDQPREDRIEFRLEPIVLSGRVSTNRGVALPGVAVTLGAGREVTNDDGLFEIVRAIPGELSLTRSTWQDASVPR
jgi:hypothetical protein